MEIKEVLKLKNIKVTKGRILIYDLLLKTDENLTVEEIYKECKKEEDLNLSTVYRTLELFEKNNLVDKIFAGDGISTYTIKRHKHSHIVECNLCHKEIEVDCPMTQIEEILKSKTGFKLTEHKLQLKGLCEKCAEE